MPEKSTDERMITIKFNSEVTKSISEQGFEDNVKQMKKVMAMIFIDAIIFPEQNGIPKRLIVPMTNVSSYWIDE